MAFSLIDDASSSGFWSLSRKWPIFGRWLEEANTGSGEVDGSRGSSLPSCSACGRVVWYKPHAFLTTFKCWDSHHNSIQGRTHRLARSFTSSSLNSLIYCPHGILPCKRSDRRNPIGRQRPSRYSVQQLLIPRHALHWKLGRHQDDALSISFWSLRPDLWFSYLIVTRATTYSFCNQYLCSLVST